MPESDPEYRNRKKARRPIRINMPVWASILIAVTVLAIAAATLTQRKVR